MASEIVLCMLLLLLTCIFAQDLEELQQQRSYTAVFGTLSKCKENSEMSLLLPQIATDLVDVGASDLISLANAEHDDIKEVSKKYQLQRSSSYHWLISCICSSLFDHYLLKVSEENKVYRDEIDQTAKRIKKNSQNSRNNNKNKKMNKAQPARDKRELVQELYLQHDLCVDYKSHKHNKYLQKDEL